MSRPKITLENYEAVYDFYDTRRPKPRIAKGVHWLVSKYVKPDVHAADGALEQVGDHFKNNGRLLLVANHVSMMDPFVLASLAEKTTELRPLRGNTFIPGKPPIFTDFPFSIFRRPVLDNFVAVPAFRKKDEKLTGLDPVVARALRQQATLRLLTLFTNQANDDSNIAFFPDGERITAGDTSQNIRSGIGRIACGINDPARFLILPVGIHYDAEGSKRKQTVYIEQPFGIMGSAEEITANVQASIRASERLASAFAG